MVTFSVSSKGLWKIWVKVREGEKMNHRRWRGDHPLSHKELWTLSPTMKRTCSISKMRELDQMLAQVPLNINPDSLEIRGRMQKGWLMTKDYWHVLSAAQFLEMTSDILPLLFCGGNCGNSAWGPASASISTTAMVDMPGESVTVCSKQPEKQFWQQDRKTSVRMTYPSLRAVEDGFWQIKQNYHLGMLDASWFMPWSRKELPPFSPAVYTSISLHLTRILLAIDIWGQKHFMSLSINQSQFC